MRAKHMGSCSTVAADAIGIENDFLAPSRQPLSPRLRYPHNLGRNVTAASNTQNSTETLPKVNYEEGSTGSNLYSSMEWALTEVDNIPTYLGKWGHRMLAWTSDGDDGEKEPALYLIAGDAVEGGSFVSDVFVSTETREKNVL